MLYFDNHIHTEFSFDSQEKMENACLFALDKKMGGISFTDHFDCNYPKEERINLTEYKRAFDICKEKFPNIYLGVEIAQPFENEELYKQALNFCDYDIILMSLHNNPQYEDFYFLDYSKLNTRELLERYFDILLKMVETFDFDVLTHLDYPFRYISSFSNQPDVDEFNEQIDKILKAVIEKNKVIEVNTSNLYKGIMRTLPEYSIVERYAALGGKTVSLGSDAHCAQNIGNGFENVLTALKKCKIDNICFFEKRNRIDVEIK
ncbi:MAG: histidinol-phosphatase HisJ family protein [Ruminococcaceae bacterium]|nr:histidinol-phosphatase HisJ family protein [Oscillospiraceae bacterium]